jgi:hypothetical protein
LGPMLKKQKQNSVWPLFYFPAQPSERVPGYYGK